MYPDARLFLTGHSMGGSVATLSSILLHLEFKVSAVYSYGSPRVGNLEFALTLAKETFKVFRVVLAKDIYPHLPPAWLGYHHTG